VKEEVWTGRQIFPTSAVGSMTQSVPPGSVQIGCFGPGLADSNTVELVDVHSYYKEPRLECSEDEQVRVTDLDGTSARSMSTTARNVFHSLGLSVKDLEFRPPRGYLSQHFSDPTDDPMVQVNRRDGDDPVAFVHLRRTDDQLDAPWAAVAIDSCPSFLEEATSTETTAATG
jgi:hypothetical protein